MTPLDRPRLRGSITPQIDPEDDRFFYLADRSRISPYLVRMPREAAGLLALFDGESSLRDIQALLMRELEGEPVSIDLLEQLAGKLDAALMLDSPRFEQRKAELLREPIREPACIGCYAGDPDDLREQLQGLFTHPNGPGLPNGAVPDGSFHGALIPHIDFHRGGLAFAWAYKELVERCAAEVFVILGTSHHSLQRFTLTRKNFRTPLGDVPTDTEYVDRIAAHYGDGVFDDELEAHIQEHSIEFQAVLLQYVLSGKRPFTIVPLLIGSFHECIEAGLPPSCRHDIQRMIEALKRAEAGKRVCYLASGDLAHIGPKFGDPRLVDDPWLDLSRRQDHRLLERAAAVDLDGFFQVVVDERDTRRICGFPPTYTLLAALEPGRGRVLHYDQYVAPDGQESVSFASVAFYR